MAVFDNMNYSYSNGVSPSVIQYYERTLLENMKPEMVHARDCQKRSLPLNNGKTVNFRRFTPFGAITKPLAEGVTPNGQTLEETAFTAMVKPYGDFVALTDEINLYMLDNIHQETARLLSDQAALSLDTICRDAENAGMNVQYANGKTSRAALDATDKLTYAEIKKAVRTLKRRNVRPFPDGYYHAIVHPDVVHDLTSDSMWTDVAKYQNAAKVEKYELGTCYKVKFFESTNAKVFQGESYVYGTQASLTIASYVAAEKYLTYAGSSAATGNAIDSDIARELTGKMFYLNYTVSSTAKVAPVCVERVDYKQKRIYLRWALPEAASASLSSISLNPQGAGASGADVFSTLIYGADAFGTIELGGNGKNVSIIIKAPGSSGAVDPLEQRGTIAWKVKGFCTVVLQDDFVVRLETGATA